MVFIRMGILVSQSVSQFMSTLIVCILQIRRYRIDTALLYQLHCLVYGTDGRIAFGRTGHISCCLSQNNSGFRHTKAFHCQCGIGSHHQGIRIGIGHILCRTNHNASCNKSNFFSRCQHPCQIINSRIGIRPTHTLYKSRDGIVMIISVFVIS